MQITGILEAGYYLVVTGTVDFVSHTRDWEFPVMALVTGDAALSALNIYGNDIAQAGFVEYRVWDDETGVDRVVHVRQERFGTPGAHLVDRNVHSITTTLAVESLDGTIEVGAVWKALMFK